MELADVLMGAAVDQEGKSVPIESLPGCHVEGELDQPAHERHLLRTDGAQRWDRLLRYEEDMTWPGWPRVMERDDLLRLADPPHRQQPACVGESEPDACIEQPGTSESEQELGDHGPEPAFLDERRSATRPTRRGGISAGSRGF